MNRETKEKFSWFHRNIYFSNDLDLSIRGSMRFSWISNRSIDEHCLYEKTVKLVDGTSVLWSTRSEMDQKVSALPELFANSFRSVPYSPLTNWLLWYFPMRNKLFMCSQASWSQFQAAEYNKYGIISAVIKFVESLLQDDNGKEAPGLSNTLGQIFGEFLPMKWRHWFLEIST